MRDQDLDKLIADALGDVDRTLHDQLDDRWDQMASGDLSEEDMAVLSAMAETSGEAELAMEAFSPLGTAFEEQVVADAQRSLASAAAPVEAPKEVVSWWSRLFAPALRPAWGMAAAALLVVGVLSRPTPEPLVPYSLEVHGLSAMTRGDDKPDVQELVIAPDGRLELLLSPATATDASPEVSIVDGEGKAVTHAVTREAGGTLSVRVAADDLGGVSEATLHVQLGDGEAAQRFTVAVRIQDGADGTPP